MKTEHTVAEESNACADDSPPIVARRAKTGLRAVLLIALVCLLLAFWAARAFATHGNASSELMVAGATVLACGLLIAAGFALAGRRSAVAVTAHSERLRRVAWAAASPAVLLAFYLPEYLAGAPVPMWRSLLLLIAVAAAALFLFRLSGAGEWTPADAVDRRSSRVTTVAFACVLTLYFALITALSLRKLSTLGYAGQDLAYFSQIFYTTLHGQLFQSNFYQDLLYTRTVHSDFAGHNSPIQYIFVAFYRFWPMPATNLVVRNLFMTMSAIPAFLLARTRFSRATSAFLAGMFLCLPAIFFQNLFEFYPFSLAAFFLLLSFWLYARGDIRWFLPSLLLLLLVREDLVFAVFTFAVLAWLARRGRIWVIAPILLSVLWAVLSWRWVLPHFLEGAPYRSNVCFAHLGSNAPAMIHAILHHPTATVLTRNNLIYLKQMMTPFGGVLSWLSPAALGALPYLFINLLGGAGECPTTAIFSQHSVVPTVFLFVGFLWSLSKLCARAERKGLSPRKMAAAGVALTLALTFADLIFASYPEQVQELATNPVSHEVHEIVAMIPGQAAVAVPRYMAPLFANRMSLYMSDDLLDYHHPYPTYVIIDRSFARMRRSPKWRQMYDRVNASLVGNPDMRLIYHSDNYLIYQRGEPESTQPDHQMQKSPPGSPPGKHR